MTVFLLLFISIMLFLNSIIDSMILLFPLKIFSGIIAFILSLISYGIYAFITKKNKNIRTEIEEDKKTRVNTEVNRIIEEMKRNK